MTDHPEDPFDDLDAATWDRYVRERLIPQIRHRDLSLIVFADSDARLASELGEMILLDKPIILVVYPGIQVPEHLARVADEIVEGPILGPEFNSQLQAAVSRIRNRSSAAGAVHDPH